MATRRKAPRQTNGHTPVSNQPVEVAESVGKPAVQPPAEGMNPRTPEARDDGTEAVKGYKRVEASAAMMAEFFTAPTSTELRDIGEASFGPPPPAAESVIGT